MISIINHGLGNFASVISAIDFSGHKAKLTNDRDKIKKSEKIIIPGVKSCNFAMKNLKNLNLIKTLNKEVLVKKKSILGICLDCQLPLNSSEEGAKTKGLVWDLNFKMNKKIINEN